jgi:transposase-like protein
MGATKDGKKKLIAMTDGHRESAQSWRGLLLDVKRRGMKIDPKLAVGDGALGFWKALAEVSPMYFDGIVAHVRGANDRVSQHTVYVALGVNLEGREGVPRLVRRNLLLVLQR